MVQLGFEGYESVLGDRTNVAGSLAWKTLQERAITPTPRNFELLFTHFSGSNRSLSERLAPLLAAGATFTAEQAETLYDAHIEPDAGTDLIDAGVEGIAAAAQTLVEQVASNQGAFSGYGDTLAYWTERMSSHGSVEDLIKVVASLSQETGRVAERSRILEGQLAASTSQIAKLRQDLIEVRQEATTDALTGIANRKAFDGRLRRLLAQARKDSSGTFSLIMIDVDHFKSFNDRHGHRTGDQVLRLVGRLLSDNVKGRDTAARYGGEEFAVLLADADLSAGRTVAEQMCQRLASQRLVKRGTGESIGQITISAGVAQHRHGESATSLIERADAVLYEAKRTGRNRACCASG